MEKARDAPSHVPCPILQIQIILHSFLDIFGQHTVLCPEGDDRNSRLLAKPIGALSRKTGLSEKSALGFISTLATSVTTFDMMKDMDPKGIILNSAFAVSASFVLADHLAFTMAFDSDYILPMMLGKVVSGISALVFAALLYKYKLSKEENV